MYVSITEAYLDLPKPCDNQIKTWGNVSDISCKTPKATYKKWLDGDHERGRDEPSTLIYASFIVVASGNKWEVDQLLHPKLWIGGQSTNE